MCVFSFTSARYLGHLCVVTTAWVFPAIQSHTKGPHKDSFRPASRQLYSTHPDNNFPAGGIHSDAIVKSDRPPSRLDTSESTQERQKSPFFPAVDFSLGISDIGSVHRLVPPTGMEGFVHLEFTLNVCSAEAVRGKFFKEDGFSHSLH